MFSDTSQDTVAPTHDEIAPQTIAALKNLRNRYPDTPFLTLGQTVLWDEPVKAALCRLFGILSSNGTIASTPKFVAGVHDTDYFAKLEGVTLRDQPFVVLRHNDGDTRGLWSAAGELSALFGAEIVTSRHELTRDGVSFQKAAKAYAGGAETLLNQETDAPLWRAIVCTEDKSLIAADVKLREILPALRQQLRWGFRESLISTGCPPDFENDEPCPSRDVARKILGWIEKFDEENSEATLSELYKNLIPKIWQLVRNDVTCDLETTTSMSLFQFNGRTASRPRFRFVDLFLNPATREKCKAAYNDSVRNSGIYTLDQFGEGALPFDVVIPGKGRGTLRFHEGKVTVETEPPIEICDECDPESVFQLAALLESHFGPDIALVGKAVSLISMLSAEFIFVFHEKASGYTKRTAQMNAQIRAANIPLDLHPLLRLKYRTWDSLEGLGGQFTLPPHLAVAFKREKVGISEFASLWEATAKAQDEMREKFRSISRPNDLMRVLAEMKGEIWSDKETKYIATLEALALIRSQNESLTREVSHLRNEAKQLGQRAQLLQSQKGDFFRKEILPLQRQISVLKSAIYARIPQGKITKEERQGLTEQDAFDTAEIERITFQIEELKVTWKAFDVDIRAASDKAHELKNMARKQLALRLDRERTSEVQTLREALAQLENEAQLDRLLLVRDAQRASQSLHLTNFRPTAWWLPMVSPDGRWFNKISDSILARIEDL
jgi:hypothetical protein